MNQTIEHTKVEEPIITHQKNKKENLKYLWHILLIAVSLILLYFSMKQFVNAKSDEIFIKLEITLSTFAVWISEYLIIKGITQKTKLSLGIVVGIEIIFDIINYFIRVVRGSAITISDMVAIRTGLSVVKNINFKINEKFIYGLLITSAIIAIIIIFSEKIIEEKETWKTRSIKIIIGLAILITLP